jgi:phospholipid transport system substrate-binding protein
MSRPPRAVLLALLLTFGLSTVSTASGGPATDHLRDGIERVLKVLEDPELRGADNTIRRKSAVARVTDEIFDFTEMSRRALGRHWDPLTAAERQDFALVFSELLKRSYFARLDEYGSRKPVFRGETVEGGDVIVSTTLDFSRGTTVPLDYAMHSLGERWRVYDVRLDGTSLVANYRAQFSRIIRTSSYATLVTRLRTQQSDFAAPTSSPSASAP